MRETADTQKTLSLNFSFGIERRPINNTVF